MIRSRFLSRLLSGSRCSSPLCTPSYLLVPVARGRSQQRLMSLRPADLPMSSTDFKDWFPPGPLYSCPWDANPDTAWLQPLDNMALDYPTRHVIQLLQELYKSGGLPQTMDIISTDRCNVLLEQLVNVATSKTAAREDTGAWHRADAILRAMQLFDDALLVPSPFSPRRVDMLLPHPSRETFNLVLQVCASTPSKNRSVPDRALEICQALQHRFQILNDESYRPDAFHYNCVLNAWLQCRQGWHTPAHAAQVFLKTMTADTRDSSSFVIMLKICAQALYTTVSLADQKQANELGGLLAIKIWQEVIADDDSLDLKSHVYTHFLQALRNLPLDNPLRAQYFGLGFERAKLHGKVNAYLINEFMVHCRSPAVYNKFLGEVRRQTDTTGMSVTKASHEYFRVIPESWKRNADLYPGSRRE